MKSKLNENNKTLIWCLISALVSFSVIMLLFFTNNIIPFGNYSFIRKDAIYQFVPLLEEFVSRIKGGEGILYSFNSGLGGNFYSTLCYYLINPFNLVALLFPQGKIVEAYDTIIVLNTMAITASAAWYVQNRFKKHNVSVVIFSILYTFTSFYLVCFYNTMWLMPLFFLPLVARGIERIVNGEKVWLYLISLALCILCNFYLSFMICIFSVLYFFTLLFSQDIQRNGEEHEGLTGIMLKFGGSSLAAGGLSAFSLLPVFYALSGSYMKSVYEFEGTFFISPLKIMLAHTVSLIQWGIVAEQSTPMIGLGAIATVLASMYLFIKKLSKNEKVAHVVLVLIFWASFSLPLLYNIWHGMSSPAGMPYRFSFIYCFIILILAYNVYLNIKEIPKSAFLVSAILIIASALYGFISYSKGSAWDEIKTGFIVSVVVTAIMFVIALIINKVENVKIKAVIGVVVLLLTIVELPLASKITYKGVEGYKETNTTISEFTSKLENDNSINRMEFASPYGVATQEIYKTPDGMYGSLYGYNGVTGFSSLADYYFSMTQMSMGNIGNSGNAYAYNEQTPIYNTMFGMKYIVDNLGTLGEDTQYTLVDTVDGTNIYTPNGYLGFGLLVNPDVANWGAFNMNSLLAQSTFWASMTGVENVFGYISPASQEFDSCKYISQEEMAEFYKGLGQFEEHDDDNEEEEEHVHAENEEEANLFDILGAMGGIYAYKVNENSQEFSISFEIVPEKTQNIYLLSQSGALDNITVVKADKTTDYYTAKKQITDIGLCQAGETIKIVFSGSSENINFNKSNEQLLDDTLYFVTMGLDSEAFEKSLEAIKENGTVDLSYVNDTKFEGTVNATKDCIMFMPMPLDEGWSVYIDGEKTELINHDSHILMFEIAQGEHTVEMKYFPQGLKEGIFASLATALVIGLVCLLSKMSKMKEELAKEEEEKKSNSDFEQNKED